MKKTVLMMIAAASMMHAACTVEPDGALSVGWEAYKTPAKAGVAGSFGSVTLSGAKAADSVKGVLEGSSVTIKSSSVDSKNPGRDAKLAKFFFGMMAGDTIVGTVTAVEGDDAQGVATVAVTMNGVTKKVPMRYSATKEEVTAQGTIDLADFSALAALKSINKACYELHQGKTWQDVAIRFSLPLKTLCP